MKTIVGLAFCLAFGARAAIAQTPQAPPAEPQHDVNALAKQTQNPVADLTAVPLQCNFNSGDDLEDRSLFLLNFQPVPLGFGFSKTAIFNRRPVSLGAPHYYNVERPDGAPGQQLRFLISFLFPR